jgi:hypothetical protein
MFYSSIQLYVVTNDRVAEEQGIRKDLDRNNHDFLGNLRIFLEELRITM